MEAAIQAATNAVGRCVTEEALKRFDTDGSPIRVGEIKLTARGRDPKEYQTPYGAVQIERYVYQSSRGRAHLLPARAPGTDRPRGHAALRQPAQPQVCAAQRACGADGPGAEPWPQGRHLLYSERCRVGGQHRHGQGRELGVRAAGARRAHRDRRGQSRRGHDPDGRQRRLPRSHGRDPVVLRPRR